MLQKIPLPLSLKVPTQGPIPLVLLADNDAGGSIGSTLWEFSVQGKLNSQELRIIVLGKSSGYEMDCIPISNRQRRRRFKMGSVPFSPSERHCERSTATVTGGLTVALQDPT